MSVEVTTLDEFAAFRDRVLVVAEKIREMGYGTQAAIAFDCRLNQSRISNVLRARVVDIECIDRIEAWLKMQAIEQAREAITA